ncbi:MAG: lytic murein transglycosylase B, partial [Gammaproteobacteria bacterium]|nr:lytic murein transglycosylase B [Gammaproteobacteria bacterium]
MIPTPHGRQRATAAFAASIAAAGTLMLGATPAWSLDLARPEVREFLADLVTNDGFDPQYLSNVFAGIESKQGIIDAMSRPAEKVKPWSEYRAIFLTPRRISSGVDFFHTHETELRQIARKTGVPPEIIAAIVGVETFYGTRTGSYRAVDALATLAFDYPPRSKFFRGELRQLFLLARDEQLDVTQLTGSYAGALGPPQFIPSSYRNFSVDGDNDGRRNLLSDWNDIFASVANYFVVHNWQRAQPVAVPARLKPDNTRGDTENELVLRDTVESLSRQGVDFSTDLPAKAPAMLISLAGEEGTEYWVGFQNFYAITRYNR